MPKPTSDCRATERKHPWPMVRLGDVCVNLDHKRIPITKSDRKSGKYPYYGASGIVDWVSDYIFDGDYLLVSEDGANLTARTTPIAFSVSGKVWVNNHAHVLSFADIAMQRYVEYYFASIKVDEFVTGAAQPKLTQKALNSIEIPVPSPAVQREVVARLERELAAVEKMKQDFEDLAETAKAEFKAELKGVFEELRCSGVEMKRLGEVGRVAMCKRVLKAQTSDNGDVPFFKIGTFGKEPNAYISNELFGEFIKKFSYPKKGDVLISAAGTIGRTIVFDGKPSYFQDSNIVWLEHDGTKVANEYLHCFYWSKPWKVSDGATIPRIYNGDIESAEIPLPSLPVQRQTVDRLSAAKARAEKLETKAREGMAVCETMRKAILKEAFE